MVKIDNKKMWESLYKYGAKYEHFEDAIPDALKDQGLQYNPETKEIESIEPETKRYMCIRKTDGFKVGHIYKCGEGGKIVNDSGVPFTVGYWENYFRPATEDEIPPSERKLVEAVVNEPMEQNLSNIFEEPFSDINVQYTSIEAAIKAHAEDYSFNIESELFNQLTKEQQGLWRKEIEQAVLSGGYSGLSLATDNRYKQNPIEQKPDDKVEPKFKIGDWIVVYNDTYLITDNIAYYGLQDIQGNRVTMLFKQIHKDGRLWTIQDAKDGDVLVLNGEIFIYAHRKQMYSIAVAHCFVDSADGFYLDGEFGYTEKGNSIYPATKEQHDLLFTKMKKAGYEWDADEKELYKLPEPADVGFEELGERWKEESEVTKESDQELTEFESKLRFIIDNNPSGVNFKVLSRELLSVACKHLQPEFDAEIEQAYKNQDEVVYNRGYEKAVDDACKWLKENAEDYIGTCYDKEGRPTNETYLPRIFFEDFRKALEKGE